MSKTYKDVRAVQSNADYFERAGAGSYRRRNARVTDDGHQPGRRGARRRESSGAVCSPESSEVQS